MADKPPEIHTIDLGGNRCQHTEKQWVQLGVSEGFSIEGQIPGYEKACHLAADSGHKYCQKHELEHLAETEGPIQ